MRRNPKAVAAPAVPVAPESSPRVTKRAKKVAGPSSPPAPPPVTLVQPSPVIRPAQPTINPAHPKAKAEILARFPKVKHKRLIAASVADAHAAAAYLECSIAQKQLEGTKEIAGNRLRLSIGDNEGLQGDGFIVTWKDTSGQVDWPALARDHGISSETIDKYRKGSTRTIAVTGSLGGKGDES